MSNSQPSKPGPQTQGLSSSPADYEPVKDDLMDLDDQRAAPPQLFAPSLVPGQTIPQYMNAVPMQAQQPMPFPIPQHMNAAPMQPQQYVQYMNAAPMPVQYMSPAQMQAQQPMPFPMMQAPVFVNAYPMQMQYQRPGMNSNLFGRDLHQPNSLKTVGVCFKPDSVYRDDQPAEPKPVSASSAASSRVEDKLELSAKAALSPLQGQQELPCMISLKGVSKDLEEIERARPGLDLVCVIDISGSMGGDKVELIRETMGFLVTKLTKYDRLSIVIFDDQAYRVCPLLPCDEVNRPTLEDYARRFTAEGGTNMLAGLECGLKVLASRRTLNTVTSLFFLSDGQDNNTGTALARSQIALTQYRSQIRGDFTLHTFGYGSDHDSNIMCNMADQGLGAFHYVEKLESIAEAFADSFGGLVSQVARSIEVRLELLPAPLVCRITKMYTKTEGQVYRLPAIMANESKDLVFLLDVAGNEVSEPVDFAAVRATVSYLSVTGAQVTETVDLRLSVLQKGVETQLNVREDVLVNFYRVKGAEILKEVSGMAENRQFKQAQACLQRGISEFRESLVASHALIAAILRDLEDAVERVRSAETWNAGGAAQVKSAGMNHYAQVASSNTACYMQPQQAAFSMQYQAYKQAQPPHKP